MNYIVQPASVIPGMIAGYNDVKGKAEFVFGIFEVPGESANTTAGAISGTAGDEVTVEFSGVDFHYNEEKKVLENISFTLKHGSMTALVSASGGGKSTILKLLCGFYEPVGGNIRILGKDLKDWNLDEMRRNIAIVSQNVFLFPVSIAENISYGKPGATFDEIAGAARLAGAHDFIMDLPEGYESIVGERGAGLSGGQRQRISIARAMVSKCPVLLLDEPSSALDTETENIFHEGLEKISRNCTVLVAAHRLSTIQRADRIIVLNNGSVEDVGTHRELIGRCGTYRNLYEGKCDDEDAAAGCRGVEV
jgi:subfamily B ATP-binding cassette protein MsbA/ATP-binding cassette subfamily B protein AbcA/BmrA